MCPCGAKLVQSVGGESTTLVGYSSPRGHDHDDNCIKRLYICARDHRVLVSLRRKCPTAGCDWQGKKSCSCHLGDKVDEWPEVDDRS